MKRATESDIQLDLVALLFLFALFLLVSPLVSWWAASDSVWFAPFVVWGLIIAVAAWAQRHLYKTDDL